MAKSQSIAAEACADTPRRMSGSSIAGVWARLAACTALSVAALGARTPETLAILTAANLAVVMLYRVGPRLILKGARILAVQAAVITVLYVIRYGTGGVVTGLRISWQIYLAFLPGTVFMHATPVNHINAALAKVLPYRTAFVLSVSAVAIPYIVHEITAIYHTQALRGARILPRHILRPSAWPDFVHCLIVPSVVKVITMAQETALASKDREFGGMDRRTFWPGD